MELVYQRAIASGFPYFGRDVDGVLVVYKEMDALKVVGSGQKEFDGFEYALEFSDIVRRFSQWV